ncbi:MAG: hypothetical protein R3E79_46515 [Caldilineaceae bacterium]
MSISSTNFQRAIVIGGSMAGLLTARVLSNHFTQVILLERDEIRDQPEARKGQPQTRHLHGLLAKGLETMLAYFPTLVEDLIAGGALVTDMGQGMRWYTFGGYRRQFQSGMTGALMSRPFLEWQIRRHVLALPNVRVIDGCAVEGLTMNVERSRVTGVQLSRGNGDPQATTLTADLVVDAGGRGSASPKWLAEIGYAKPVVSLVKARVGYATRLYRRKPGDLDGADLLMIAPDAPHGKRTGLIFPLKATAGSAPWAAGPATIRRPMRPAFWPCPKFARSRSTPDAYAAGADLGDHFAQVPRQSAPSLRRSEALSRRVSGAG